jgi:hypothetical protein
MPRRIPFPNYPLLLEGNHSFRDTGYRRSTSTASSEGDALACHYM